VVIILFQYCSDIIWNLWVFVNFSYLQMTSWTLSVCAYILIHFNFLKQNSIYFMLTHDKVDSFLHMLYTWHAFINSLIIFLCYMVFLWIFGLFPNSKKFSKSSYKFYDPSQKCVIQCVLWFLSVFISISAIWLSTGSPFLYGIIFCNTFMFLIISSGLTWFVLMSW
jgi:hypothetical protein